MFKGTELLLIFFFFMKVYFLLGSSFLLITGVNWILYIEKEATGLKAKVIS